MGTRRQWLFLLLGLVVLAGCAGASGPFSDDFSNPASGWGSASTEAYVRGYDSGRYLIRIDVPNWFAWTTAGQNYTDVAVEAVVRSEGMTDNHYGLLCRAREDSFYYFALSADGYYAIFRRVNGGGLESLTGTAMLRSPLINKGSADNRLRAECTGPLLTFYVNGAQIAQVEDELLKRGDVGMAAGTVQYGTTTLVWFDDFAAAKPVE